MGDKEWATFGYDSSEPCCVCGKTENIKSEPRFGYSVCQEHADTPPTEIHELQQGRNLDAQRGE